MVSTRSRDTQVMAGTELVGAVKITPPSTAQDGVSILLNAAASVLATPPLTSLPLVVAAEPPPPSPRPKVLCLGMSYASMERQLRYYNVNPEVWLQGRTSDKITVQDVLRCVQEGMLTEMDARDLARCVATEVTANVEIYTVSQEKAALYDTQRHLFANFNRHSFIHQLHVAFAADENGNRQPQQNDNNNRRRSFHDDYEIVYRQVILDYFWIPQGWDDNHWSRSFFADILPDLVRQGMLEIEEDDNNNNRNDTVPCGVYLPFCFHCFRNVINALPLLRKFYEISFLRRNDLHEVSLWKGTQTIDRFNMRRRLGKDLDQENIYCTFGYQEVMEAGTNARDEPKHTLVDILSRLEDFREIRMIKLRPLRQHHPTLDLPQSQHERGGLKGLMDPKSVKRGFLATAEDVGKCVIESKPTANSRKTKMAPSTPRAKSTTATTTRTRRTDVAVTKRKRASAAPPSTPLKKTKQTIVLTTHAESSPTKRALFRGNNIGMPTRSRTRALSASNPAPSGPPVPLYDEAPSSPPRRSSRRHITFVSLPTRANKKRRSPVASKGSKVLTEVNLEQAHQSTRASSCKLTKSNNDNGQHVSAPPPPSATTMEPHSTGPNDANLTIPTTTNPATPAASDVANSDHRPVNITAEPMLNNVEDGGSEDKSSAAPPSEDKGTEGSATRSPPAVTPSPSRYATNAKNDTAFPAEPMARRALACWKPQFEENADNGELPPPDVHRETGAPAKEVASDNESANKNTKAIPLARASLAAFSLAAVHHTDSAQYHDMTKATHVVAAATKGQEQSVLLTTNTEEEEEEPNKNLEQSVLLTTTPEEQDPQEVSDSNSSVTGSEESVGDDVENLARNDSNTNSEACSVLETLHLLQSVITESDSESSSLNATMESAGLSTRERLEYLGKELDPASRTGVSTSLITATTPQTAIQGHKQRSIGASPNPFMTKKAKAKVGTKVGQRKQVTAAASTRRRKKEVKLPFSSKVRRQEWNVRKNEGPLSRRDRPWRRPVPESVLMRL